MADDIAQWLEELGLGQYAEAFADNGVELDHLAYLTDEDFAGLGVPLGPRRKLQAAIEELSPPETAVQPAKPLAQEPKREPAEAERRQLTVLFCDLVGSTALSAKLDPEDYRDVMRVYQEIASAVIRHFDGHVAKYLGDGILAYFGYPRAHEDDAERAVRAGLELGQEVAQLRLANDVVLESRVGIATGLVVVGDLTGEGVSEQDAVSGETPNLAARLQEVAEPGSVVVAEGTRRLLGRVFAFDDLGDQALKGITGTVGAWRITGERATESRFEAARTGRLTPFIGREHETALLLEAGNAPTKPRDR